jgi:hypothetical protein
LHHFGVGFQRVDRAHIGAAVDGAFGRDDGDRSAFAGGDRGAGAGLDDA